MNINALGRNHLRAIARLICDTFGDGGPYRQRLGADIESVFTIRA